MKIESETIMSEEKETKIGKRSFISLEVFIMAIITTASMVTVWANLNNGLNETKAKIAVLTTQYQEFGVRLSAMDKTLNGILVEARIQNELAKSKMTDRWTAAMEEDITLQWFELNQKDHPGKTLSDMPNVREIQRKHGYGVTPNN